MTAKSHGCRFKGGEPLLTCCEPDVSAGEQWILSSSMDMLNSIRT